MFWTKSCISTKPNANACSCSLTHPKNKASRRQKVFQKQLMYGSLPSKVSHTRLFHICNSPSVHSPKTRKGTYQEDSLECFSPVNVWQRQQWKPTRIGARQKKDSWQVFTFALSTSMWQMGEMSSHPRWLLAPSLSELINNLWKCGIIVMAFRQPGCDTAAALANYLFKN